MLPQYLAMGMSADEFWNGDVYLVKAYEKAFRIRQDLKNQNAWVQGMYFYEALIDVAPALRSMGAKPPTKYPSEPFEFEAPGDPVRQKQRQARSDAKARTSMEAFMIAFNKQFDDEGVSRHE